MRGMDRETGGALEGLAHLRQSIADILSTPIGSRVLRRDYGSRLPDLMGRPAGQPLMVDVAAATAEALTRWEPRWRLTRVILDATRPGEMVLTLIGRYLPDGQEIRLEGVVVS